MQIFVSYSRKQFYFAEALAHELALVCQPWLDVHELTLGQDWNTGLRNGLDSSDGLVLVASKASIGSKYVETEWRHILEQEKPVVVILFEPVTLPSELQLNAAAIFTFPHWRQVLVTVDSYLKRRQRHPHSVSKYVPRFWHRLSWMEPHTKLMSVVLVLSMTFHYLGALLIDWPGMVSKVILQIVFLGISLYLGIQLLLFIRRKFDFDTLQYTLIAFNISGSIGYSELVQTQIEQVNTLRLVFSLTVIGATVYVVNYLRKSDQLLRWLPTGEASIGLRQRHYPELGTENSTNVETSRYKRTFTVYNAPEDQNVASLIIDALTKSGHTIAIHQADIHLLLISNYSDASHLATLATLHENFLTIVVSPIRLSLTLEALGQFQWLDFRSRTDVQLQGLIDYLDAKPYRVVARKSNNVPEGIDRLVLPPILAILALSLRFTAMYGILASLVLTASGFLRLPNGTVLASIALPSSVFLLRTVQNLECRATTVRNFAVRTLICSIVFVIVLGTISVAFPVFIGVMLIIISRLFGTEIHWKNASTWFPIENKLKGTQPKGLNGIRPNQLQPLVLALIIGVWVAVYLPGYNLSGLIELVAFHSGFTKYDVVMVDENVTFNVPYYFDVTQTKFILTPKHLEELGSSIWSAQIVTGMSTSNLVNIHLLRYEPTDPQIIRQSIEAKVLPFTLASTPAIVGYAANDPSEGVSNLIRNNFSTIAEQMYPNLLDSKYMTSTIPESQILVPNRYPKVLLQNLNLPFTYLERKAILLNEEITFSTMPNVEIKRFDVQLTTSELSGNKKTTEQREWLITVNTSSKDFILYVEGDSADLAWYRGEILDLVQSLIISEPQRLPFISALTIGPIGIQMPTEYISGVMNIDDATPYIMAPPTLPEITSIRPRQPEQSNFVLNYYSDPHFATLWAGSYQNINGKVAVQIMEFKPSQQYYSLDTWLSDLQEIVDNYYAVIVEWARSENSLQRTGQLNNIPFYWLYKDNPLDSMSNDFDALVIASTDEFSRYMLGLESGTVNEYFVSIESGGTAYLIWIGETGDVHLNGQDFATWFLSNMHVTQ